MASLLTLKMIKGYDRPVISLKGDVTCLIDTGANAYTERLAMVAYFIILATAFKLMNYTIRNVGIEKPVIEIEHDREEHSISPVYSNLNAEIIERVYSFSNE